MNEDIKVGDYLAIEDSYKKVIWVKVIKLGKEYLLAQDLQFPNHSEITLILDRIKILYNKKFAYDRYNNRINIGDKVKCFGEILKAKGFYQGWVVVDRKGKEESIDLDHVILVED